MVQKNLKWVLEKLNISLDKLTSIINTEGGRDPNRPIIYHETCQQKECKAYFFSNTQDHMMRLKNGYPVYCPKCREIDRKEKKKLYAKNRIAGSR